MSSYSVQARAALEARKRKRAREKAGQTAVNPYHRYIDDPVGFCEQQFGETYTDDVRRVMESVRDNPITIAVSANGTGKTHGAARIAAWWYKSRRGLGAQVYTASAPPKENLELLLWGELGQLPIDHPQLFHDDKVNHLHIAANKREFITGVTIPAAGTSAQREARFSGKHAPYLLFILDEADAIPSEVFRGIESCLSGGNGRLLVMFNPRSEDGPIAAMRAQGVPAIELTAFNHPNVITGQNVIPGAVTRDKTVHRIHRWTVPATPEYEAVTGYGRFTVPEYLIGYQGVNESTGRPYAPLPGGERIITHAEFCYMVLARYPGVSRGVIFDTWRDGWQPWLDRARLLAESGELPYSLGQLDMMIRFVETGTYEDITVDWATLPPLPEGNVSPKYEYEEGAGAVFWAVDDGYAGAVDPDTGSFTPDSHPRVILFCQLKANGDVVVFDEYYLIREPEPKIQINAARERPYKLPEFVVLGPGSAALSGLFTEVGFFKRTCMANVEESIKHLRRWVSPDENGHRRLKVHPRCKHLRFEMARYKRDDNGRIKKEYDHGPDAVRYLAWVGRNGF